jgi:hypothetical protein
MDKITFVSIIILSFGVLLVVYRKLIHIYLTFALKRRLVKFKSKVLFDNSRRGKTLLYLTSATIFGWAASPSVFVILPPILFGLALYYSNKRYEKLKGITILLTPILFFIIFMWGSMPFYGIGQSIFTNPMLINMAGSFGAFILVMSVVKLNYNQIIIGLPQIVLLVALSVTSVLVNQLLKTGTLYSDYNRAILDRFDITILVYQSFMAICIISSFKSKEKST